MVSLITDNFEGYPIDQDLTITRCLSTLHLMDYKLEELQWKCQDCDATAPPTGYDFMKLVKHQKGHHIRLVNTSTGEIVATTVKEARLKGIDIPVKSGADKPLGTAGEGMELTEEGITLPITLPPYVFTMFDAAKAAKLIDDGIELDAWLVECVQKRFELEYRLRLALVPIGGTRES